MSENINKKTQTLSDTQIKEYVLGRFEDVKNQKQIKNLVSFQTMNKYMIMAHSQKELKILGNIVASYKKNTLTEIMSEYEKHLKLALEKEPTIKTHSNAILHIFGSFSKKLNKLEKEKFQKLLKKFTNSNTTIGEILSEIEPIIYKFNNTYLASQTYFLLYSNPQRGNLFELLSKGILEYK